MARTAENAITRRPQNNTAVNDFDDRGKKFTTFINGNAIKNLLTQSLGGPQAAAQLTSTLIAVVQGNPKLQQAAPMEILAGALRGEIGMGLSLILGDYSIIPYENYRDKTVTAQFQLQVNGIKRMCIASGAYEKINCYEVRDGEFKGYDPDTWEPVVVRNPNDEEREQLPIVGYYAFYRLNKSYNGFTNKIYWPYDKILRYADRYSKAFDLDIWNAIQSGTETGTDKKGKTWYASKKREGSPWYGDPADDGHMKMCKKTMLKQLLSDGFAPKSTIIQNAITADNAEEKDAEPAIYADEFDRMAREAALEAAREPVAKELPQSKESVPDAPAPVKSASRASQSVPKNAQANAGNGRAAAKAPASAPIPMDNGDFPDYDMTSGGELPFDLSNDEDPLA